MPPEASIAESAKQRSLRVPLDHYRQVGTLVRVKCKLTALTAIVASLYVVWLLIGGNLGQRHASPSPVAAVHAGWNDDCLVCHRSLLPLRSDAISLAGLFGGQEA